MVESLLRTSSLSGTEQIVSSRKELKFIEILKKFDSLTQSEIASLQFHLLEIGTLNKKTLSPEYFNCLPPLTEIETE